jgi:hypothetical protein
MAGMAILQQSRMLQKNLGFFRPWSANHDLAIGI